MRKGRIYWRYKYADELKEKERRTNPDTQTYQEWRAQGVSAAIKIDPRVKFFSEEVSEWNAGKEKPQWISVDHIHPLRQGGSFTSENIWIVPYVWNIRSKEYRGWHFIQGIKDHVEKYGPIQLNMPAHVRRLERINQYKVYYLRESINEQADRFATDPRWYYEAWRSSQITCIYESYGERCPQCYGVNHYSETT